MGLQFLQLPWYTGFQKAFSVSIISSTIDLFGINLQYRPACGTVRRCEEASSFVDVDTGC
jgi:hypothetical protein